MFLKLRKGTVQYLIKFQYLNFSFCYRKFATFLNFKNLKTCLKEAILVDYYVSGFLWARGMDFSVLQYSKFMTLLDVLLHNLRGKYFLLSFKERKYSLNCVVKQSS